MRASLRLTALTLFSLAGMLAPGPVARAETLRVTCDNYVEQLFVDGAPVAPLGPNSNDWMAPDDYALSLAPGAHVIALRARDDGSTIAGCMLVLFADDGTTPIARTVTGALRTVSADPGAGWESPGLDDSAWSLAGACPSPGPWGGSLAWGRSVGAEMVWGPDRCDGPELASRRWFRFGVEVPECLDATACNDGNECTSDTCVAGRCARAPLVAGTPCSAGICDGASAAPLCVACVDSAPATTDLGCAAGAPHCRTTGPSAPICEVCADTTSGGLDLGCASATPNCVVGPAGRSACVACESDAQCADADECTANACGAGMCSTTPLPFGSACSAGICDINRDCSDVAVTIATPSDGSTTGDATPTYSGIATPGATVTVVVDGATVGTAVAAADGTWSLTPATPLAEGAHTASASVSGGGRMASDTTRFVVDLSTRVEITAPAEGSTTRDSTPEIRGTGEPGATIVVSVDGAVLGTVTVGADGTWVLSMAMPLANGAHTADAVATDTVGNTARARTSFTVDARTEVDIREPASGSTTRDDTPRISGTAAPGASVAVTVDGMPIGTVTAAADGTWSIDVTTPLADGAHTAEATATDGDGNVATDASTFTVDTGTAVEITELDGTMVRGTGEPGATIVVTIDGMSLGLVTVAADGTWSVALDEPLAPGTHEATASATDGAGNTATDTETVTIAEPTPDAGVAADASVGSDAGPRDAGARDAAAGPDAGVADGGAMDGGSDAGSDELGGYAGGALCAARPGRTSAATLALLGVALALALARRRR
jgi:hypothetical protein